MIKSNSFNKLKYSCNYYRNIYYITSIGINRMKHFGRKITMLMPNMPYFFTKVLERRLYFTEEFLSFLLKYKRIKRYFFEKRSTYKQERPIFVIDP